MRYLMVALCAVVLLSFAPPRAQADDPAMCLKACIDQNGADQKKSCAVQCGYASGASGASVGYGGQKKVDCGIQYKTCLAACPPDNKDCRKQCREQRTGCI